MYLKFNILHDMTNTSDFSDFYEIKMKLKKDVRKKFG